MKRNPGTPSVTRLLALALAFSFGPAIASPDPLLVGCWRSQQVEVTMSDKTLRNTNGDCVIQYTATQALSRCQADPGQTENLSSYEVIGPGQLRVTPLDPVTSKPKAAPATMAYRIEGDWLLFDRPFPSPAATQAKQPIRIRSISVRVPADGTTRCEPRGETGVRIGRTPKSSLSVSAPPGWRPLLLDPATDKRLGPAVNSSLFLGAFTPMNATAERPETNQLVIVLDDTRHGPLPVKDERFESVKRQFSSEFTKGQITCDEPDRICASIRQPDGGHAYTELLNLKGRVAIITGAVAQEVPGASALLEKAVQGFVEKLREENRN
ncbi:hypothetical protein [Piscinibacter gummiphilus]|uniref:Uncharacterized protein n=1 Tax=Piscinibacter gummiphilus TaxID=946333 RepID=A0ABZ0CXT2_9BURK|nr:hypothetical protein [Piscinibacter gummiphilus]WOB07782.1 hypothetical protein RXV79_23100 [Piscinibacter gummiphilus]